MTAGRGWTPALMGVFSSNLASLHTEVDKLKPDRPPSLSAVNEIRGRHHILAQMILVYGDHPHTTYANIRKAIPKTIQL